MPSTSTTEWELEQRDRRTKGGMERDQHPGKQPGRRTHTHARTRRERERDQKNSIESNQINPRGTRGDRTRRTDEKEKGP